MKNEKPQHAGPHLEGNLDFGFLPSFRLDFVDFWTLDFLSCVLFLCPSAWLVL